MKKVVFKGVINGKEFDNVNDYNDEMQRVLGEGGNVNASSSTNIVDEPMNCRPAFQLNEETEDESTGKTEVEVFDPREFLLFFNVGDEYYLDKLVTDDDELNDAYYKRVHEMINKSTDKLKRFIKTDNIQLGEAVDFINKVKDVREQLRKDYKNNEEVIEGLTTDNARMGKQINENILRIDTCHKARPVIEAIGEYYCEVFDLMKQYLLG